MQWVFTELEAMAKLARDPDPDVAILAAEGVPVGFNETLPRTPLVYEEKTDWALDDLSGDWTMAWGENHPSAAARPEELRRQFLEDVAEGLMVETPLEQAVATYGQRFLVASCGAVR